MGRILLYRRLGTSSALLLTLAFALQVHATEEALIACTADPPTVTAKDSRVLLTAWLDPPGDTFTWKVDAGSIRDTGSGATWDLNQAAPGEHHATLGVTRAGQTLQCTMKVSVLGQGLRQAGAPGGAFLLTGREEAKGYGLYSYLLFGEKPRDDVTQARYRAVTEEYLLAIGPILDLEGAGIPVQQINLTYLPVIKQPTMGERTAEALLNLYDYARARKILMTLPGEYRGEGPYIVSTLVRLGTVTRVPEPFLFQDLSLVQPNEVKIWARAFLSQAAQERYWEERTLIQLGLKARTIVAVAAEGYPKVKSSLEEFITWKTKLTK